MTAPPHEWDGKRDRDWPVRLGHFRCYFDKSSNKCELDHTGERRPRESLEASFGICPFMPFPTPLAPSRRCAATWGSMQVRLPPRATRRLHPCRDILMRRGRVCGPAPLGARSQRQRNEECAEPSVPVHRATRSAVPNRTRDRLRSLLLTLPTRGLTG
jgi:hypothetical protein